MGRMFQFIKPYKIAVIMAVLMSLLELSVELTQPLILSRIIDHGIIGKDMRTIYVWGGILVGMAVLSLAAGVINSFYSAHAGQNFGLDLRRAMYKKIQYADYASLQHFSSPSLLIRLTDDVTQIQQFFFMGMRFLLRSPLLVIGSVIVSLVVNFRLALVLLCAIPLAIILLLFLVKRGIVTFESAQAHQDEVNHIMRENLIGVRFMKAFVRKKQETSRFVEETGRLTNVTVYAMRLMQVIQPVTLFLMNIAVIIVVWIGSKQIDLGNMELGNTVAIINYAMRISSSLSMMSFMVMAYSRGQASAKRIWDMLDHIEEEETDSGAELSAFKGDLAFDNVSFHYPEMNRLALKNISFKVEEGATVAVFGATGSGKTSLFNLIPRLYEPSKGMIKLGGQPIQDLSLQSYRQHIAYVAQETLLFSGTIADNISWGSTGAPFTEIEQVAKDAQIHDRIVQLPGEYETRVGQRGTNLSGGQRQRIAIARALLTKPDLLLLDDATSALDATTEAKLLRVLRTYPQTTILITQKIGSARAADKILFLDKGAVLGFGTHEELMAAVPMYRDLIQSEAQKGAENA